MRIAARILLVTFFGACSQELCQDADLDGYGEACSAGDDCDDNNAARTTDCLSVPVPDCSATPRATGCPCLGGSTISCYAADEATLGVSHCHAGSQTCVAGNWGRCVSVSLPQAEQCDGVDQDCDGRYDEGVLSPCGGCDGSCTGAVWGEGDAPFAETDELEVLPGGELVLRSEVRESNALWVANTGEATLSRFDADSYVEVGRYATAGLEPSRVAVDFAQHAWVLNRNASGQGSLTRVAAAQGDCVDRNQNGTIETSVSGAVVTGDECVLSTFPVGDVLSIPRALAVDGDFGLDGDGHGSLWVGLYASQRIERIDPDTGRVLEHIETPGFSPYAASVDRWGTLWMVSKDGLLLELAPNSEPLIRQVPGSCYLSYGLETSSTGEVMVSGFECDKLHLWQSSRQRWTTITVPESPRGLAFSEDEQTLYMAHTGAWLSAVSLHPLRIHDPVDLRTVALAPLETIGVAVLASGAVAAVSTTVLSDTADERGVLTIVEGDAVVAQTRTGLRPHTQGDLSGRLSLTRARPSGSIVRRFEGCPDGEATRWHAIHLDGEAGRYGSIEVQVRHAPSSRLESATFVVVGTLPTATFPQPLSIPEQDDLEVMVTLRAAGAYSPRVMRVGVEYSCESTLII